MFGRRTPAATAEADWLMPTPNSAFWDFDEPALRLTNSALDAELTLADTVLAPAEWDRLPPVPAICRAGELECHFTIVRRQLKFKPQWRMEAEFQLTWWCVDFSKADVSVAGSTEEKLVQEVDVVAWRQLDRALGEGLQT